MSKEKSTLLRVASDAPYSVGRASAAFGHEHPEIRVVLSMGNAEDLERQLEEEAIDIAILVRKAGSEQLLRVPFGRHSIVLLVGMDHPWASRDHVKLAELHGQYMAMREARHSLTSQTFEKALEDAGVTPAVAMQVNTREHLREVVAAGMGIGVGIATDVESDFRLHRIWISDANLTISDELVCKKVRAEEPSIKDFFSLALTVGDPDSTSTSPKHHHNTFLRR